MQTHSARYNAGVSTIDFFRPSGERDPSGGNKFNRRIIERARECRFPLRAVTVAPEGAGSRARAWVPLEGGGGADGRLCIWDSLLMARYSVLNRDIAPRSDAFLMHYLPSLDPGLNANARDQARALEDRIAEQAAFFIATGRGLAALLRERYPGVESFICEPGVDSVFSRPSRRIADRTDGVPRLLTIANLVPAKGYRDLARILLDMTDRDWVWHLAGRLDVAPEFTGEFRRSVAGLIASGRIVMHGSLASAALARLMFQMDVFVSASHFESYGMALAEAVAAGLPVVATQVGEARRIVGNGSPAQLIPVGAWDDFAAALAAMIGQVRSQLVPQCRRSKPARSWDETFADFAAACRRGAVSHR